MKSIQPLITPTVFKASTLDGSRTSEVSSSSVSNRTFSATVTQQTANPLPAASASSAGSSAQVDAKPISGGSSTNSAAANSTTWTLKLTVDNTQGKSIEVISDRPLPSGTRVELQPVKDHPELLKVVNIKIDGVVLDPMKIDPRTIDPSTTNTNTTTASTVNTLTDASKTASTPLTNKDLATTLKVLADALRQTNLSPIPTPAVKTLLASRLPWLDMGMRALAASTAAAGATQSPPTSSLLSGYSAAQTSLYGGPSQLNKQAQQVQATTQGNVSNTLSGNSATSPIKALPMGSLVTQLQALSSSASNLGASSGANSGTGTLPHSVQQALTDLLSRIPSQNELMRPEGIKNAIQRAPVNYESQLVSGLKQQLAQISQSSSLSGSAKMDGIAQLFKGLWRVASGNTPQANLANQSLATSASNSGATSLSAQVDAMRTAFISTAASVSGQEKGSLGNSWLLPTGAGLAALDNSRGNIKGLLLALVQSLPNSALGNGSHKALLNSLSPALASLGSASFTASPSNSMADQVGDILRQAQTILARVENEQVRFISTNDPQLLSIPLLWKNEQGVQQSQLEMQSSKEGSKNSAGQRQSRWQLTLRFDLPYLGELDIELDLKPPSVAATFWSEEAATRARLNETLAPLRSQLQDLGAEVRELKVRHGRCPANTTTIRHSLVDVHT